MEIRELIYNGEPINDWKTYRALPVELQHILDRNNGFVIYGGGFHLRGACLSPAWHSLDCVWHGEYSLSGLYSRVLQTDIPFAQDCMGDQYLYRDGNIMRLHAESGELEDLHMNLYVFQSCFEEDAPDFLHIQCLQKFEAMGGKLQPGQSLLTYPPLCFVESALDVSFDVLDTMQLLLAHSRLAASMSLMPADEMN